MPLYQGQWPQHTGTFLCKKFIFTVLIFLAKIAILSLKMATRHCLATTCQRPTSMMQPPAFPPSPSSLQRFPAAALPSSGPQTPPPPAFKPLRLLTPSCRRRSSAIAPFDVLACVERRGWGRVTVRRHDPTLPPALSCRRDVIAWTAHAPTSGV